MTMSTAPNTRVGGSGPTDRRAHIGVARARGREGLLGPDRERDRQCGFDRWGRCGEELRVDMRPAADPTSPSIVASTRILASVDLKVIRDPEQRRTAGERWSSRYRIGPGSRTTSLGGLLPGTVAQSLPGSDPEQRC